MSYTLYHLLHELSGLDHWVFVYVIRDGKTVMPSNLVTSLSCQRCGLYHHQVSTDDERRR